MRLFPWSKKREKTGRAADAAVAPGSLLSFQTAVLQGIGARTQQEDSFAFVNEQDVTLIRERGLLAVVADGMGGMAGGKAASEAAVASFVADHNAWDYHSELADQLCASMVRADKEIFRILSGAGGSTAILCLLYQEQLFYAGVGDSFLFVQREGELYRINREHNILHQYLQQSIRSGHMDRSGAENDPERAALTQFLGMGGLDDIDYLRRSFPLRSGDVVLLCTDGVGGVLTEECITACLSRENAQQICSELERYILMAGRRNQDNYTALVIRCEY